MPVDSSRPVFGHLTITTFNECIGATLRQASHFRTTLPESWESDGVSNDY
jgi:hypothetical protein